MRKLIVSKCIDNFVNLYWCFAFGNIIWNENGLVPYDKI